MYVVRYLQGLTKVLTFHFDRSFEVRLRKTEEDARVREERAEARIVLFQAETREAIAAANVRAEEAERRMEDALAKYEIAKGERLKAVDDKLQAEAALIVAEAHKSSVIEERDQATIRADTATMVMSEQQVTIDGLKRQLKDAEDELVDREERLTFYRSESLRWYVGLGVGCMMTIGGVGCTFTFGIASLLGAGIGGSLSIGGVICVLDKVLSSATKAFLREMMEGLLDEFALALFLRTWIHSSGGISTPPMYLLKEL